MRLEAKRNNPMASNKPWHPFRLDQSKAQRELETLAEEKKHLDVRDAFQADAHRIGDLTLEHEGMFVDMSKQRWDREVRDALVQLADEADVHGAIEDLFGGVRINTTENRAVLHMALRGRQGDAFQCDGQEVMTDVLNVRHRMLEFVEQVHAWHQEGQITDVVNIGIGGSDLGPAMAVKALRRHAQGPECHFVSNVDGAHLESTLQDLDPSTTMLVIVSKTFTTQETMANATLAKAWLEHGHADLSRQLVAVSTNLEATRAFGVEDAQTFGFENWVGGRYSMWGPVGMCIAMSIGRKGFEAFLEGARSMDVHVQTQPLVQNIPVILALLGHWNQNLLGFCSHVVLPYAEDQPFAGVFAASGHGEQWKVH